VQRASFSCAAAQNNYRPPLYSLADQSLGDALLTVARKTVWCFHANFRNDTLAFRFLPATIRRSFSNQVLPWRAVAPSGDSFTFCHPEAALNRNRLAVLAVFLTSMAIVPLTAQNRMTWERRPAQIYSSDDRGALSLPSTDAPSVVVEQFLASHGHDAVTVRSIAGPSTRNGIATQADAARFTPSSDGLMHVRVDQRVDGLVVYGSYVKAAINAQGQVVHLIENLAPVSSSITRAIINEDQALRAALGRIHPGVAAPRLESRLDNSVLFARGGFFYTPPTATRVLVSTPDGSLREGFLVETWTRQKNLLQHTLVSGEGQILNVELRTNTDQYFVYIEDPSKEAAQTLVSGPTPVTPAGTVPSPNGWLNTGTHKTINIAGNNVHAYLDASPNNQPDTGGTSISNGAFTTVHSRTTAPSTTGNRAVAVQNLFYLNNRIHDVLYAVGFNESEANFQENNFSRGGSGSDSVNAEAQDGGGTDNANFATPNEGQNPRMQMYLFTGKPSHQAVVGASIYDAAGAEFGPALTSTGKTGAITLTSPADGCTAISTTLTGKIAVMDRGTCSFAIKVKNAQLKGAIGVIVANNAGDSLLTMGGTDATITIPSIFVGQTSGTSIKAAAGTNATIRITTPAPLQRDGDIDADIVFHEYGHGLTWRMIGNMSGSMSGAIGEGMSDVLALIMNGDDKMGEYASTNPLGIRTAPYANFPRTYGSVTGSEVHLDGEIYGAIGWRLLELYTAAGLTSTDLLRDLVQGMRFTPAAPNYQQMRDGILAATATNDCKVWTAFAQYGVGSGATSSVNGTTGVITVSESFTIPAGVCP
jgi:extracellular elastinolytic metalloproteinase